MAEDFTHTRRIYLRLSSANNNETPVKLCSLSVLEYLNRDFQASQNFYNTFGWFTTNYVSNLICLIKIGASTMRRARIEDMEDRYSIVEQIKKREGLQNQPGIYLDLIVGKQSLPTEPGQSGIPQPGNLDVIESVRLLNIADNYAWNLGSKLTDNNGKMLLEEDDILYCRIRNAGWGMLGANDALTITGSIEQKVDCFYKNHIISEYKQGVHF